MRGKRQRRSGKGEEANGGDFSLEAQEKPEPAPASKGKGKAKPATKAKAGDPQVISYRHQDRTITLGSRCTTYGARRRSIPDFLIRLSNGKTLVLEIKGEDSEQNRAKRSALDAWVKGVNSKGGFGAWCGDVAKEPAHIQDIVQKHGGRNKNNPSTKLESREGA